MTDLSLLLRQTQSRSWKSLHSTFLCGIKPRLPVWEGAQDSCTAPKWKLHKNIFTFNKSAGSGETSEKGCPEHTPPPENNTHIPSWTCNWKAFSLFVWVTEEERAGNVSVRKAQHTGGGGSLQQRDTPLHTSAWTKVWGHVAKSMVFRGSPSPLCYRNGLCFPQQTLCWMLEHFWFATLQHSPKVLDGVPTHFCCSAGQSRRALYPSITRRASSTATRVNARLQAVWILLDTVWTRGVTIIDSEDMIIAGVNFTI